MNDTLRIAVRALLALVEALVLLIAVPLIVAAALSYALLVCTRGARIGVQHARAASEMPAQSLGLMTGAPGADTR